jgi:plasmid stabilization system protein ParE
LNEYTIEWLAGARDDLRAIFVWLSETADPETAETFVSAIIEHGDRLRWFPARGTPRPDLGQNVHSIAMRRRVTIAYRIAGDGVQIVAVRYAGQDWPGLMQER